MDLAGVAPASAPCKGAPRPHAQARWTRRESHPDDLPAEETSDLSHEPVDPPGIAPGPPRCERGVRPSARAHGGSGRNRTLIRGFGGRVAASALTRSAPYEDRTRLTRETTELRQPVASRGIRLLAVSRTRPKRLRSAPPASGRTRRIRVSDENRTRTAGATTQRADHYTTPTIAEPLARPWSESWESNPPVRAPRARAAPCSSTRVGQWSRTRTGAYASRTRRASR